MKQANHMNDAKIMFEKFEIIHCLKKDAHTSVYLARHIYLGKNIILKVLDTAQLTDTSILKRFKREAKILARLDHSHIIKVLDFGVENDRLYLSFEYFENQNLRELIKANKLTIDEKKSIIAQLVRGLDYAHKNQIIHRDLKPENILVNQQHEVKIADFGLSLYSDENNITHQASIVGTPGYMSPEQIRGEQLSPQSDLFSLGVIMYELFLGSHPFIGQHLNDTLNNILQFNEATLFQNLQFLPSEIQSVLQALLQKDVHKRNITAAEIISKFGGEQEVERMKMTAQAKKKVNIKYLFIPAALLFVFLFIIFYQQLRPTKKLMTRHAASESKTPIDSSIDKLALSTIQPDSVISPDANAQAINYDLEITAMQTVQEKTTASQTPGKLLVQCSPWADVYIDSIKIDTTPMDEAIRIYPGKYTLKLIHPKFPPYIETITIKAGQLSAININLDQLFGYLLCQVYPWGEIYIDNTYHGQTPLSEPIILTPGRHLLTVKNPEYSSINEYFNIQQGDTSDFKLNFEKIIGLQNEHPGMKNKTN